MCIILEKDFKFHKKKSKGIKKNLIHIDHYNLIIEEKIIVYVWCDTIILN